MLGTFGGALEARQIDASHGRLTADVTGEVEAEEGVNLARFQRASERSEEHTSELQSLTNLVCRLLLEKKKRQLASGEGRRLGEALARLTRLEPRCGTQSRRSVEALCAACRARCALVCRLSTPTRWLAT